MQDDTDGVILTLNVARLGALESLQLDWGLVRHEDENGRIAETTNRVG